MCTRRVVDDGFNFSAMTHYSGISEKTVDVAFGILRNFRDVKIVEAGTKVLSLTQNGEP